MKTLLLAIFCLISVSASAVQPCQILRNNLYNAGVAPGDVMLMVASCISNVENLRVEVLTDPEEIKSFRQREFIASPVLVDKSMEVNE